MNESISRSTDRIGHEISANRIRAHAKHGDRSIELEHPLAIEWVAILVEEVGELAHEFTYDAAANVQSFSEEGRRELRMTRIRAEAMDVATVAVALIAAIDRARDND